ncbi:cation:proton antiporter [Streptomyces sp. BBFR2]|uniref:cation:proton antiporter n=1 Tax=Streptomyces sp. BBFR2 TaxID=3372854 RepID=UPI0037DA3196
MGEILLGLLLGPTLLHGQITAVLFPSQVRGPLELLSQLGVVLFMFLVGAEFDPAELRGRGWATGSLAVTGTLVPFGAGVLLALYGGLPVPEGRATGFVLFMGVALAVTAFPVLTKVLHDRDMIRTPVGRQALTTAAAGDVLAWVLLAVVVAANGAGRSPVWPALVVPFALFLFTVVRPLLRRLRARAGGNGPGHLRAVVLAGLLASSAFTQWIGLDAIFGAFLFGVALPREQPHLWRRDVTGVFGQLAGVLLPVYFVVVGIDVDLGSLAGGHLGQFGLVMAAAVLGKALGVYPVARLHRLDRRTAGTLTVLMNTRGLTELIILGVGLRLGLLDHGLYALLVAMAILTTLLTGPVLGLVYPRRKARREPGTAEPPGPGDGTRSEPDGQEREGADAST